MRSLLALAVLLGPVLSEPARARGGESALPTPLVAEPAVRWSFGPLAFESAPVSTGSFVIASGRESSGRRALVVLDAASGRMLSRTLLVSSEALALSASGERLAVRTTPQRVDLFRLRGARLLSERSIVCAGSISIPHLAGDVLTLREGGALVRYDLAQREPLWRATLEWDFAGTPAVHGAHVFAAGQDADGAIKLAWIDGESGEVRAELELGKNQESTPLELDMHVVRKPLVLDVHVELHGELVWVRCAPGLTATNGKEFPWTRAGFDGERLTRLGSLYDLLAPPLATERGWIAPERTNEGTRWILAEGEPGRERVIELASPAHHAWLSAALTPPSRAGDVLYLGPAAVDANTLEVLWRRARSPSFRALPVAEGLLVIEGERLHLLGAPAPAPDADRERAYELAREGEKRLGEQLGQLAWRAARAGDGELAGRLAAEAEALGANERTLRLVQSESERLRAAGVRTRGASQALLAEEAAARAGQLEELAKAARLARGGARRALLDELFQRSPAHPEGLALLARLVPAGARVAPEDARAWLEFLTLSAAQPIETVPAAEPGRAPTREQLWLAEERAGWRPDLVGYQSKRLLVITAGAAPDAVARTLRGGELVCDVLEDLFGGSPSAAERLELLLYPTREEYLAHSGSDLGGFETVLGFTSGHFDLGARTSRFFLPSDDEKGAHLASVSTHELAHHWLATRSRFGSPRAGSDLRGFWIVEAIATWAEELVLTPENETWSTAPQRAASLDTTANAGPRDLHPWSAFLELSFDDYCRLETRPTCTLTLDWQLGVKAPRSPLQLFYAQGAALAHWLYEAEQGRHRQLLFRAVEAYYRGTPLDVPAALGTNAQELGERVVAWARGLKALQEE